MDQNRHLPQDVGALSAIYVCWSVAQHLFLNSTLQHPIHELHDNQLLWRTYLGYHNVA